MNDILKITLLYDFYSELLTDKQRSFFEMYYFNDLSLSEIGGEFGITAQGVRDLLKRTEKILTGYEAKLNLVSKHMSFMQEIDGLKAFLDKCDIKKEDRQQLKQMLTDIIQYQ